MTRWLVDRSAVVRLGHSPDADEWASRIERGLVAISTVTRLEVGFSARSADDHARALRLPPIAAMPVEYLTPAIEDRAVETQALLAARGQHRAPRFQTCWSPPPRNSPAAQSSIRTRTST